MEKYLVFALECLELNPSVKMYDLLMTKFLKEKFQAEIPNLVTKWTQQCWSCFKGNFFQKSNSLKHSVEISGFSVTQILREINIGESRSALKSANICKSLSSEPLHVVKC